MLFGSFLVGVILAGGTSAVIAFRQFSLANIWRDHVSSWAQLYRPALTMGGEQAIPRLIVQSSRGYAGEPIPLGLTIHGPTEGAVIIITGLLPGMDLSNGLEVDVHRWEVPANDIRYTWIAPPDGFVGSVAPTAELRLADDSVVYRQVMHLEWVASSGPGLAENQYDREEPAGPTPPVPAGERDLEKAAAIPVSPSLAPEQGDRQEVTISSSPPGCHHSAFVARARRGPVRLEPPPRYDLIQQRQNRICRERLGDIRAIAVARRHLFSGKAGDENKGNAARHQNIRHGKGVMAVDAHVEQRSVQSLALDRLERALQGGDRTDNGPFGLAEDRLDQSGNHRLIFDDQHPPARAHHTRLPMVRLGLPGPVADIPVRLG